MDENEIKFSFEERWKNSTYTCFLFGQYTVEQNFLFPNYVNLTLFRLHRLLKMIPFIAKKRRRLPSVFLDENNILISIATKVFPCLQSSEYIAI